jgi:hypothetical protein
MTFRNQNRQVELCGIVTSTPVKKQGKGGEAVLHVDLKSQGDLGEEEQCWKLIFRGFLVEKAEKSVLPGAFLQVLGVLAENGYTDGYGMRARRKEIRVIDFS